MLQIVHEVSGGKTRVVEVPPPLAAPGHVVVATMSSVISAGTERYVIKLAQSSLISKARQRPDHVRRVVQKLRADGLLSTWTQVRAKLQEPIALGYSAAGVVLACGHGVHDLRPGDRVAVAGPHAGIISVGRNLCASLPNGLSFEQAAYAPLGAIALQGVRLAHLELGSNVLVIGVGLLGLLTVGLLRSSGCSVWAVDPDSSRFDLAKTFGVSMVVRPSEKAALGSANPEGFDAVIITAAAPDDSTVELAADLVRMRGRVVAVGLVGLNLPRDQFFRKEIELTVSHSLGVGRGDERYETSGTDYPRGQTRWTVRRNIETVVAAMASGSLPVAQLTSHRFPVERAADAYELITSGKERYLGVVLDYDEAAQTAPRRVSLRSPKGTTDGRLRVSLVGVGNYARLVMLPALASLNTVALRGLCSAKGLNAEESGTRHGFTFATSDAAEIFADQETDAVVIATRHDAHAEMVVAALTAGKNVFVEKPLCLTPDELTSIDQAVARATEQALVLTVGFNRRFTAGLQQLAREFAGVRPLTVQYRFAVPQVPATSWLHADAVGGGRVIGEACHAIDACTAIVGAPPVRIFADVPGTGDTLARADDRVFMTIRHADGSLSNVAYIAGGDRAMPAERIEVIGSGKSAVLDHWTELTVWNDGGRRRHRFPPGKGQHELLEVFVRSCLTGSDWPIPWAHIRATTLAAMLAEQSTREGVPFDLESV